MTDDQLEAIRDRLIAELPSPKSSAAKYTPALEDWRIRNADAPDDLDRAEAEVRELVNAAHARAVANMRQEFARPDMQAVYGGKTPAELQALWNEDQPIYAEIAAPTLMEDVVKGVLDSLVGASAAVSTLLVTKDGRVLSDAPQLQALIDAAIAATGKTVEELTAARTESRVVGYSPSARGRCWSGIPYTYNVPPLKVIEQALAP